MTPTTHNSIIAPSLGDARDWPSRRATFASQSPGAAKDLVRRKNAEAAARRRANNEAHGSRMASIVDGTRWAEAQGRIKAVAPSSVRRGSSWPAAFANLKRRRGGR